MEFYKIIIQENYIKKVGNLFYENYKVINKDIYI